MLHSLAIKPTFWWLKSHGISPTTPAGRVLSMTDLQTCAQLTHDRVLLHWKVTSYCSQNVNWKKYPLTRIPILVPWSCLFRNSVAFLLDFYTDSAVQFSLSTNIHILSEKWKDKKTSILWKRSVLSIPLETI